MTADSILPTSDAGARLPARRPQGPGPVKTRAIPPIARGGLPTFILTFTSLFIFTLTFTFSSALAQSPTRISSDAPILNWRLPSFTPEGYRESLVRGSEARLLRDGNVDLKDLTLTLFSRDATNRVETILISPTAHVLTRERAVTGESAIRVINDQFEAAGVGWRYDHETKKVSIQRNVRVVLQFELKDLLQ